MSPYLGATSDYDRLANVVPKWPLGTGPRCRSHERQADYRPLPTKERWSQSGLCFLLACSFEGNKPAMNHLPNIQTLNTFQKCHGHVS